MSEEHSTYNYESFKKHFSANQEKDNAWEAEMDDETFEKEALEGFQSLANDAEALKAMQEVRQKIALKTGLSNQNTPVIPFRKIATIAASVLVFVMAAFLINKTLVNDNSIAHNDASATEEERIEKTVNVEQDLTEEVSVSTSDSNYIQPRVPIEVDESVSMDEVAPATERNEKKEPKNDILEDDKQLDKAIESNTSPQIEVVEEEEAEIVETITTSPEMEDVNFDRAVAQDVGTVAKTNAAPVVEDLSYLENESEDNVNTFFDIGKDFYNRKQYSSAISYFESAINNNKNIPESNYYIGLSYYNLSKSNKAVKFFDNVIASASPLANNAKWYKAIIMEDKGKLDEAKALYTQLANGNSAFKNQAQDKLNSLND